MGSKWFVHRRSELSTAGRPLGLQSQFSAAAATDPGGFATGRKRRIRTEVTVDRSNGSRRPKTIITITKSSASKDASINARGRQAAAAPAPQKPVQRAPVSPRHVVAQDPPQLDPMESFGIEIPSSPSSTLRSEPKYLADTASFRSPLERLSSISSVETTATVVEDGLSPWGLPKILNPYEDECYADDAAHDFDFEAELANIDSEFRNLCEPFLPSAGDKMLQREMQEKEKAVQQYRLNKQREEQIHKACALISGLKLVAAHRARKAQRAPQPAEKPSLFKSRIPLFSSYASWI